MHKKTIFFILIFLLIGTIGFSYYSQSLKKQSVVDPALAMFKSNCSVYTKSPYQDPLIGMRVTFTDDQLICLSKNAIDDTHEIYIWNKSAFQSDSLNDSFEKGVLGKISINAKADLPESSIIDHFNTSIDGESMDGDIVTSPSCKMTDCPRARRIILKRFEKTISIEEYNDQLNLFKNIQFETP